MRLHRLLRGPGHTLLLLPDASGSQDWTPQGILHRLQPYASHLRPLLVTRHGAAVVDGFEVAGDLTGETYRKYRRSDAHLVRPDGYLAASGADAIAAHLERVYGARPTVGTDRLAVTAETQARRVGFRRQVWGVQKSTGSVS